MMAKIKSILEPVVKAEPEVVVPVPASEHQVAPVETVEKVDKDGVQIRIMIPRSKAQIEDTTKAMTEVPVVRDLLPEMQELCISYFQQENTQQIVALQERAEDPVEPTAEKE